MEILELLTSKHTSDGQWISLTVETDTGPISITLTTAAALLLIENLTPVIRDARKAQPNTPFIPAAQPKGFQALPTHDRKGLLLRFVMPNGLDHYFHLPKEGAAVVQQQIADAQKQLG